MFIGDTGSHAVPSPWTSAGPGSILSAERFLRRLVKQSGRHPIYTGQDHTTLRHAGASASPADPSSKTHALMERAVQYLKDRTERFDDHFLCRRLECILIHVQNRLQVFTIHQQPEYLRFTALARGVISLS